MADQWEYRVLQAYTENLHTHQSELEGYGAAGWELVSVIQPKPAHHMGVSEMPVFYMKRLAPIAPPGKETSEEIMARINSRVGP